MAASLGRMGPQRSGNAGFVSTRAWSFKAVTRRGHRAISGPRMQIGSARLTLEAGDITEQHVDAIVNAANTTLLGGEPQAVAIGRSEEHTSELQSLAYLVCRLLLEKKKKNE